LKDFPIASVFVDGMGMQIILKLTHYQKGKPLSPENLFLLLDSQQFNWRKIMDSRSFAHYEKFGRVIDFSQENRTDISGTDAPQHLHTLDTIIVDLDKSKAGQKSGSAAPAAVLLDALRLSANHLERAPQHASEPAPAPTAK
jgi:hypothetical protein